MPRVGRKRSDRRWRDEEGVEWDSQFEARVYERLRSYGVAVRKCDKGDTLSYSEPKRGHECLACGSTEISQSRAYTPDLFVDTSEAGDGSEGYYVEVKGYFPAPKRKLFRDFLKARPDVSVRLVFETDARAPKSQLRYTTYCDRYFKIPRVVGVAGLQEWVDES